MTVARRGEAALVLLSLGSNIDAGNNLRSAARALRGRYADVRFSPLYRTPAVGFAGADFLNAAALLHTAEPADGIRTWLRALEDSHGRRRDVPRFSDRPLDVDVILMVSPTAGGEHAPPREELVSESFVLRPCADVAPDVVHRGLGKTLAQLAAADPRCVAMVAESGVGWEVRNG